ncbi:MAG: hypothetical protein ACYS4W_00345 [Planctomycetota bacterium]|jgi:hypothetical protein
MRSTAEESPENRLAGKPTQHEVAICENEIDLFDYFRVLWRRRYLILLGSILPASIVGLLLVSLPRDYKVRYVYTLTLTEAGCDRLSDALYSAENLDRIGAKLREHGVHEYAGQVTTRNLQLRTSPLHSEARTEADAKQSKGARQAVPTLVTMSVAGRPRPDMQKIASVIRDNFENVIPMYLIGSRLKNAIAGFKTAMADIEQGRFELGLELETKQAVLAKLKNAESSYPDDTESAIIIQVNDLEDNGKYLPLVYQIQAVQSTIISLEETIEANRRKYDYYAALLSLNERLLDRAENEMSSYSTIQEFHSFVTGLADDYQQERDAADYLHAYIKRMENIIAANIPYTKRPGVTPVPKGIAKRVAIVFAVSLMISIFVAFLSESIQSSRAKPLQRHR